MTKEQIAAVLENVRSWPKQDQEELAELAREIEARRNGIYEMTDDEKAAVERAEKTAIVSDDEVAAFWKARGVA
ncbi:MAG: hypothetical protein WDN08_17290 [Rhizomicrobium sp.]